MEFFNYLATTVFYARVLWALARSGAVVSHMTAIEPQLFMALGKPGKMNTSMNHTSLI